MTTINGWFDFAVREPGPPGRRQLFNNTLEYITFHSMEGNRGGYSVFYDDVNRPGIAWHGTIGKDGTLYQHYPVEAGLYHGGGFANTRSPGFELEGFSYETITDPQKRIVKLIINNLEEHLNRELTRENGGIKEHRELAGTECPSERYTAFWKEIRDMTKEEVLEIIKELQDEGSLASTTDVLACVAQIVGVEDNTYSDKKRLEKVRQGIRVLGKEPVSQPAIAPNVAKDK